MLNLHLGDSTALRIVVHVSAYFHNSHVPHTPSLFFHTLIITCMHIVCIHALEEQMFVVTLSQGLLHFSVQYNTCKSGNRVVLRMSKSC